MITAFAIWQGRKRNIRRRDFPLLMVLLADNEPCHATVRGASPDVERRVLHLSVRLGAVGPDYLAAAVLANLPHRSIVRRAEFESWADAIEAADRLATACAGYGESGERAARYRRRGQTALPGFRGEVFEVFSGHEIHRTREPVRTSAS